MNLGNAIKMAFKSLSSSKLRTFLTMLGVIIGVFTVAILTTVTDGATGAVIGNLKRESTMSMILVQKETSVKFFDEVIAQAKEDENIGAFDYSVMVLSESNVNSGTKTVDIMSGKDAQGNPAPSKYYKRTVSIPTSVYAVRSNYDVIRNISLEGNWVTDASQVVVDREFIDAFLGEEIANGEVIGTTIKLGGEKLIRITINATDVTQAESLYASVTNKLKTMFYTNQTFPAFDSSTNYIDGKVVVIVTPNAFISDEPNAGEYVSLKSIVSAGVVAVVNDDSIVSSISFAEFFDSTNEMTYTVVGVITEDDSAFSTSSSGDMKNTLSTMGTEFSALSEAMDRSAKGRAYMLIDDSNLLVLDATKTSSDDLLVYGAYLRYEDENLVGDGNIRIMIAFMQKGYKIMTDIMPISMNSIAAIVNMSMNVLTIMLTVISSISLIVGGIGIMNIMLVAVSERTREIGIRKAIGAKRSSILTQFLIEALVVSLLGGLIGLILSWIASIIIGSIMGISLFMPLWVIAMSLGFCVVIGVIFGMYPAIKASKLEPIEALRHD